MIRDGLQWWGAQLAQLWPWQGKSGAPPRRALLLGPSDATDQAFSLVLWHRLAERPLGRFAPDAAGRLGLRRALRAAGRVPLVLRLPPGVLLEREVTLPLAAEHDAAAALRHDLDRLTPFRATDLLWSADVIGRDRERGLLRLRLLLVPRAAVAEGLGMVSAAGASVAWLQGNGADGAVRRIGLDVPASPAWHRTVHHGLALACLVLAAALVAMPFVRQETLLNAAEMRLALAQPLAREAGDLRRLLEDAAASGDAIAATQREAGQALGILAALTELLPDDTVLHGLSLRQRQLGLRGQSANAARLIGLLAASGSVHGPAFTAPVTRGAGDGQDRFSLAATAVPVIAVAAPLLSMKVAP